MKLIEKIMKMNRTKKKLIHIKCSRLVLKHGGGGFIYINSTQKE